MSYRRLYVSLFSMLWIFPGERSFVDNTEDITEADSNDITEHPHDYKEIL